MPRMKLQDPKRIVSKHQNSSMKPNCPPKGNAEISQELLIPNPSDDE